MADETLSIFKEPAQTQMLNRLWELQKSNGYIKDNDIKQLALLFNLSEIEVEGVVSFYHFFHRKPTGKYTIYLNNSVVADMKGFNRIKETLERETGATFGSVDRTGHFGLFLTPVFFVALRRLVPYRAPKTEHLPADASM